MLRGLPSKAIDFYVNDVYMPVVEQSTRYYVLMGGRGAGRSTFASQLAVGSIASHHYFRCAIMRNVLNDIRDSIYKEIKDRIDEQSLTEAIYCNDGMMSFRYGKNEITAKAFRKSSSDRTAKLKSLANYNTIIIEEADEIGEDDFNQLDDSIRSVRGDIKIILLLNPPSKNHWIIKRWFNLIDSGVEGYYIPKLKSQDVTFIYNDYHSNAINIAPITASNYERYRETLPDHYYTMIKGYVSEGLKGRIYKDWKPIPYEEYKALPYHPTYWLDFGFSNDPTAFGEVKTHNDTVYLHELIYRTGLTNSMIVDELRRLEVPNHSTIVADCAEPKSIEEIRRAGYNIIPSVKGADSVRSGIQLVKSKQVHYTSNSSNIETEIQGYTWALDRDKNPTNEPVDAFNHHMDGVRYAVSKIYGRRFDYQIASTS
ncbi:MAG: phage terminase large subunit [bacterium]